MFSYEAIALPQVLASPHTDSPSPLSEQSSPTDDSSFNHFGDAFADDDDVLDMSALAQPKRKSRRPPSTAERRATHNAVERARRESLNGRFMDLAAALPNMANVKRPSKSAIVAKSLEFVQTAHAREQMLISQNDSLRAELNELRSRLGMTPVAASPIPSAVAPRPRQQSIVASESSSLLGTPTSSNATFDSVPPVTGPTQQQAASSTPTGPAPQGSPTGSPPTAFPFFGFAPAADKMPSPASSLGTSPPVSAPFPQAPGLPVVDVNYLMALSLQHQQQQNLMMQNRAAAAAAAAFPTAATASPWGLPLGMPVSATGNADASTWLFA